RSLGETCGGEWRSDAGHRDEQRQGENTHPRIEATHRSYTLHSHARVRDDLLPMHGLGLRMSLPSPPNKPEIGWGIISGAPVATLRRRPCSWFTAGQSADAKCFVFAPWLAHVLFVRDGVSKVRASAKIIPLYVLTWEAPTEQRIGRCSY